MSPAADSHPGSAWHRIIVDIPGLEFEPKPAQGCRARRPDCECDGWATPGIVLRSASLRGDKHRYYRQPRQDAACSVFHDQAGAIAFAVADGVSSAAAAETGAVDACHAAVDHIMQQLGQATGQVHAAAPGSAEARTNGTATSSTGISLDFPAVAHHVSQALHRRAGQLLSTPSPAQRQVGELLATTLVAGAAWPSEDGFAARLFRIGDSSAWLLDPQAARYSELFGQPTATRMPPRRDQLAVVSTEVTALPQVPVVLPQAAVNVSAGRVLLVGTDGFGLPLGDGDGQVGELFARQLASPPSPLWLAHVLDFSRETFDDDRTLLAMWPAAMTPGTP